jgi:hypothetical protein
VVGVDSVSVTPATGNLTPGRNWVRRFSAQVTAVVKATAAPASVVGGGTFTLNVDVRARPGHRKAPPVTGEIAVTFGGTTPVVPLTAGAAVVSLPTTGLPAGVYPVHVAFSGDRTYAPDAATHQRLRVR